MYFVVFARFVYRARERVKRERVKRESERERKKEKEPLRATEIHLLFVVRC